MKKTLLSMFLLAFAANLAVAHDWDRDRDRDFRCHGDSRRCMSAPEIDPGQALGALTLLTGTVAIFRGYRRKK